MQRRRNLRREEGNEDRDDGEMWRRDGSKEMGQRKNGELESTMEIHE